MSSFGEILKGLREERGLKQEDVANLLGVSRGAISKYENDDREPDMKVINDLTNYFGVTIDYLFGRTAIKGTPDYIADNIKLIIENQTIETFLKRLKIEIGLDIQKEDMESYISGTKAPSFGILQALADYTNVNIDFFYRNNTKECLEKERNTRSSGSINSPEKPLIDMVVKNRAFLRLAAKIIENDLDIEIVEKLIDNALIIKRNHK